MQIMPKICAALIAAAGLLVATQAAARSQPAYCPSDHDHRAHDANYYDHYDADRYSRAGDYRPASRYDRYGGSRYDTGRRHYRDRRGYRDRHYRGRRHYRPRSEVVFRRNIDLRRFNAYVTVVEENYWTRSGRVQRVCSVVPKGRDAYDVPHRRLSRIARNNCSRYAHIQYL